MSEILSQKKLKRRVTFDSQVRVILIPKRRKISEVITMPDKVKIRRGEMLAHINSTPNITPEVLYDLTTALYKGWEKIGSKQAGTSFPSPSDFPSIEMSSGMSSTGSLYRGVSTPLSERSGQILENTLTPNPRLALTYHRTPKMVGERNVRLTPQHGVQLVLFQPQLSRKSK